MTLFFRKGKFAGICCYYCTFAVTSITAVVVVVIVAAATVIINKVNERSVHDFVYVLHTHVCVWLRAIQKSPFA